MSYHIYIIYSKSLDRYYIGSCADLDKRLNDHLNGRSSYTKKAKDWILKWSHPVNSRSEAVKTEMRIKKKKSRRYLEYLINGGELA